MVNIHSRTQANLSQWSTGILNTEKFASTSKLSVLKWEIRLIYECYKKTILKTLYGIAELRFCQSSLIKKRLWKILKASISAIKVTLVFLITIVSKYYGAWAYNKLDLHTKDYTEVFRVSMGENSPLKIAKRETKNKLSAYQTVVVCPSYDSMLPKNLIYFSDKVTNRAYRVLFETARKVGINGTLVIPCSQDHKVASIAASIAMHYLVDTTRIVRFVILNKEDSNAKKIQDTYEKAIDAAFQSKNIVTAIKNYGAVINRNQIQIVRGNIQDCEAIAIPVGINFSKPESISSIIEIEFKKKIPPSNSSITHVLDKDVLALIFQKLNLRSLGQALSTCKMFKSIDTSSELWEVQARKIHNNPILKPHTTWQNWIKNHAVIELPKAKIDLTNRKIYIHDMDIGHISFSLGQISGKITCLYNTDNYNFGFYRDENGLLESLISPNDPNYQNYLRKTKDQTYRHFTVIECAWKTCTKSYTCKNFSKV